MNRPRLLTFNAGSSSIKLGLFEIDNAPAALPTRPRAVPVARVSLDLNQQPLQAQLRGSAGDDRWMLDAPPDDSLDGTVVELLQTLGGRGYLQGLIGAGHRVVHGGLHGRQAARVDAALLATLQDLVPLAPLHQPRCLQPIHALARLRPGLAQTASFDTAFHAGQAEVVRRFALPRELYDSGIRRYGFHGLSYARIATCLARDHADVAAGRVVVGHLGSGSSLCAMQGGRSIETSMGFSVLDGVPMGTRCGAIDPGVLLHLLRQSGMDAAELEQMLYHRSGLLGISGHSADVRALRARDDGPARMALQIFALRCAGEVARLATTLGGLDALVFTAGIGEHDAALRAAICGHLAWLGLAIDTAANQRHAERFEAAGSRIAAFVIATDEEQEIADETLALLSPS